MLIEVFTLGRETMQSSALWSHGSSSVLVCFIVYLLLLGGQIYIYIYKGVRTEELPSS